MGKTLEPNIRITTKGLPEEQSHKIANVISGILNHLDQNEGFDFRRFHQITITDDFGGELAALSEHTPSRKPIEFTNEEYAQAVAKIQTIRGESGFEFVLVINAGVATLLLTEDPNDEDGEPSAEYLFAQHSFHHEFCHIHDLNKKHDAMPSVLHSAIYTGKDCLLGPLAEICWSEYYANLTSASTVDDHSIMNVTGSLAQAIDRTKKDFDKAVLAYRLSHDLVQLMSEFGRHGEFLAKAAAYALGYVDGLETTLAELSPEAGEALAGSYFEPTWDAMHEALREMRKIYPDGWKDLSIFGALSQALDRYYTDMGLMLSNLEDGGYHVGIPFRPETTPNITDLFFPRR